MVHFPPPTSPIPPTFFGVADEEMEKGGGFLKNRSGILKNGGVIVENGGEILKIVVGIPENVGRILDNLVRIFGNVVGIPSVLREKSILLRENSKNRGGAVSILRSL